jgi:hypothetical protein
MDLSTSLSVDSCRRFQGKNVYLWKIFETYTFVGFSVSDVIIRLWIRETEFLLSKTFPYCDTRLVNVGCPLCQDSVSCEWDSIFVASQGECHLLHSVFSVFKFLIPGWWRIDPLLKGDSVNSSRCYGAPAAYACAVTSNNNRRGDAGGVFCRSAPRLYDSTDRVLLSEWAQCSWEFICGVLKSW